MEGVVEKRGFFSDLKRDKLLLILLVIILILGIYVRFSHYNEEGLWSDDSAFIPAGLLFFNPHSYYPALSVGNFPLGYYFIGAGCMLSGEDFSGVSEVKPLFYPGRELLIGEALTKGERFCHLPMYFFGIIFFLLISLLAFLMLDRYSATFVTAFFAFYPQVLVYSRWIRTDIVFWVFLVASLIFLWLAYNAEKASKRELVYFVLCFSFFGLSQAAKETAGIFVIFGIGIFLSKYFAEVMHYLKSIFKTLELKFAEKFSEVEVKLKSFKKTILYSVVAFLFFFLLPFGFNPKNVYDTYRIYQQFNSEMSAVNFSLAGVYKYFSSFFTTINFLDTILFIFAFILLVALVFKKGKTRFDNFILYFTLMGILLSFFFQFMDIHRLATPFLFFFIFLMGMSLSEKGVSLPNLLKLKHRVFFFVFMVAYVGVSFYIALSSSPYFVTLNDAYCLFKSDDCVAFKSSELSGLSSKVLFSYLQPRLAGDDTFYGPSDVIHFYIMHSQHLTNFQFDTYFEQNYGRAPTLLERIQYYHPNNETIRYLFLSPYQNLFGEEGKAFEAKYEPNDVIKIQGYDVYYVYDLKGLKEK
ncbi:MAG: hypothetical protein ABIH63_00180 [archaeon]